MSYVQDKLILLDKAFAHGADIAKNNALRKTVVASSTKNVISKHIMLFQRQNIRLQTQRNYSTVCLYGIFFLYAEKGRKHDGRRNATGGRGRL